MVQFDPNDYDPTATGKFEPVPSGDYPFCVIGAEEKTSKAGNAMLEVRLEFDVGRETGINVYDRLVFVSAALWKVHQFCAATGLTEAFNGGELTPYIVQGVSGMAGLVLGEENSKGKRYMEVDEYLPPAGYSEQPAGATPKPQTALVVPQDELAPPAAPLGPPPPVPEGFPQPYTPSEVPMDEEEIPF